MVNAQSNVPDTHRSFSPVEFNVENRPTFGLREEWQVNSVFYKHKYWLMRRKSSSHCHQTPDPHVYLFELTVFYYTEEPIILFQYRN